MVKSELTQNKLKSHNKRKLLDLLKYDLSDLQAEL